MMDPPSDSIELIDQHPPREDLRAEVIEGLLRPQKTLPPKLFYDHRGSELFVEITRLPEYYLTRTEIGILRANAAEIVSLIRPNAVLVDLGAGSGRKARILLDAVGSEIAYMPVDVSLEHLEASARAIAADYPDVRVVAVCSDYTRSLDIPHWDRFAQRMLFFPGSTVGNFEPSEAKAFLRHLAGRLGANDGMIIGVDLEKEATTLDAAYNDSRGVTAEFNLNMLRRINRELGADFDLGTFEHRSFYDGERHRIEMHLRSAKSQIVTLGEHRFEFHEGETIHTENSYKYSVERFRELMEGTGFAIERTWIDSKNHFGVHYLQDENAGG